MGSLQEKIVKLKSLMIKIVYIIFIIQLKYICIYVLL